MVDHSNKIHFSIYRNSFKKDKQVTVIKKDKQVTVIKKDKQVTFIKNDNQLEVYQVQS